MILCNLPGTDILAVAQNEMLYQKQLNLVISHYTTDDLKNLKLLLVFIVKEVLTLWLTVRFSQIDELKGCIEEREEELSRLRTATVSPANHRFNQSVCDFPCHQQSCHTEQIKNSAVNTKQRSSCLTCSDMKKHPATRMNITEWDL